jgi:hypothetical protein
MKVDRPFKPTGKRLENLNNLIQTKYPQDKWVLEPILPIFLSIIDSSSTLEQQEQVIDLLDKVFNDYEFRYNTILENTTMSNEFKRMIELAGLPTRETTTEENTTETLNENFVGIPAINNVFEREKTDYELAFEHFTKSTSILEDYDKASQEMEEESLHQEESEELEEGNDDLFTAKRFYKRTDNPRINILANLNAINDIVIDMLETDLIKGYGPDERDDIYREYMKFVNAVKNLVK